MKKTFIIIQSNANSTGGFVTKLQNKSTVATPFGDKIKSETFYVSGSKQMITDAEIASGVPKPITIDMSMFKIGEHEMINPSSGEVFMGKWLHLA